ncbi:MAG TPA: hypothetical protein VFN57_16835 [Thermomicrobiaceae bacterium]|nr:hypothetical protein [Thermomicrobiaceae bacterium]
MGDEQPPRRAPEAGLADEDAVVRREYEALSGVLAGLARHGDESRLPMLVDPDEAERVVRWVVSLRGVRRLTEVVAIRAELLKIPFCIAVRFTDITADETRAVLTATTALELPELEAMLAETLQMVGSTAAVETVAKLVPVAG